MMCVVDLAEYSRIAAIEDAHWWYRNTRHLVGDMLRPWLRSDLLSLDAGCGPGGNGAWLGEYGTVVGVDISPEALRFVRARRQTRAVQASVASLPLADRSFDIVIAITVLTSVPNDADAVREMYRVLRPGGAIVLFEPAFERLRRGHDEIVHSIRRYRRVDLEALATAAGLRVHRSTYAYSFLAPAAAALPVADRYGRRSSAATRSDVQRRGLDWLFAPCAAAERRWLRRYRVPFGTSVAVVATRDDD